MAEQDGQSPLSVSTMVLYGIGSFGTGIYLTVPSVMLLYFMTDVAGLAPALAGIALFIPRLYDILLDPVVGRVSDLTRSRFGRRRPYLLGGALASALFLVLLFNPPPLPSPWGMFWYLLVTYALSATAYSVFAVPYLAMPAEVTRDAAARTTLMAYRMGFAMTGIMAGSALAPWLVEFHGSGRAGFAKMSWTIAAVASLAMLVTFFGAGRFGPSTPAAGTTGSWRAVLAEVAHNRPFRRLGAIYLVQLAGLGCFNAAAAYFVIHALRRGESDVASLFFCALSGSILSMPLWTLAGKRLGKQPAYGLAAAAIVIATASLWLVGDGEWGLALALAGLLGIGFGGAQLIPFSIAGDIIQQTANAAEATYTGVWTAIEKAGLAAGPLAFSLVLQFSGFDESRGAGAQDASAIAGVRAGVSLLPAAFILLSLPFLFAGRRKDA